jgi:hypothetical protein
MLSKVVTVSCAQAAAILPCTCTSAKLSGGFWLASIRSGEAGPLESGEEGNIGIFFIGQGAGKGFRRAFDDHRARIRAGDGELHSLE